MAHPAANTLPIPQRVWGRDERIEVQPTTPPYNWICFLLIQSADGMLFRGSGFKIHLPGVNRTAIVTSGHCIYINGAYATRISVQFPRDPQKDIQVGGDSLYAALEYRTSNSLEERLDHDYGLIVLPACDAECGDGFGWSTIFKDEDLNHRLVTNCGYPGDKKEGTLWITGGKIEKYTSGRIFYMNDTYSGQSGSPVYTWYGGYWTVIAVHSYGGLPNSAPRFTTQMITRFLEFMNCFKLKSLRSFRFPNVYVRCDGSGVTKWKSSGGGTVNCQYKPPEQLEKFYIYPVEVAPSLAPEGTCKVEIKSAHFNNIFVRLDSKGMSKFDAAGGGDVNCQFSAGSSERFYLKKEENGTYSFRSVQYPDCYIRLNGSTVHSPSEGGGGIVNCQCYSYFDHDKPRISILFHVEEH